jgi:hypothetical protein
VGKQEAFAVGKKVVGELAAIREQDGNDVMLLRFKPVEG